MHVHPISRKFLLNISALVSDLLLSIREQMLGFKTSKGNILCAKTVFVTYIVTFLCICDIKHLDGLLKTQKLGGRNSTIDQLYR